MLVVGSVDDLVMECPKDPHEKLAASFQWVSKNFFLFIRAAHSGWEDEG